MGISSKTKKCVQIFFFFTTSTPIFYFLFRSHFPLRPVSCQIQIASENITETITDHECCSLVVAWLNGTFSQEWRPRRQHCFTARVSHSSRSIWTSYGRVELKNRIYKWSCPFQLPGKTVSEEKNGIKWAAPSQRVYGRPSSSCWLDWNWVWKLWSAKLCACWCRVRGRGCFWDTRIHQRFVDPVQWKPRRRELFFLVFIALLTNPVWATHFIWLISITTKSHVYVPK